MFAASKITVTHKWEFAWGEGLDCCIFKNRETYKLNKIEFTGEHSTLPFQILSGKAKKISIFSLTVSIPLGFPVTLWKLRLFSKQSDGDYDGGDNGEQEKKEEGN